MAVSPNNPIKLRCIKITSTPTSQTFLVPAIDLPVGYLPEGFHEPSIYPGAFYYLQPPENGWRIKYTLPFKIPTEAPAAGTPTHTYLLMPYNLNTYNSSTYLELMVTGTDPGTGNTYDVCIDATNSTNLNSDQPDFPNELNLRRLTIQSSSNTEQFFFLALADYPALPNSGLALFEATKREITLNGVNNSEYPNNVPDSFTLLTYKGTNSPIPVTTSPLYSFILKPYHYSDPGAAINTDNLPFVVFEIEGTNMSTGESDKVTGSATGRPVIVDPALPPGVASQWNQQLSNSMSPVNSL